MLFNILAVLVALSLPALLVIEEINSWRNSRQAPERQALSASAARSAVPEASSVAQRSRGVLPAPQRNVA